jgi:hypothetical protein
MNKTALITGASGGIGYELSLIFAAQKCNVVLVARTEDKLKTLAELCEKEGVKAHVLACDLSTPGAAAKVYEFTQSNNISIDYLINNAGFGHFGEFASSPVQKELDMIQLNITALTELCKLYLPAMKTQKHGRIMNVASTASFGPGPFMSVYFATKAYVLHFSEAIHNELKGTGVTVTALCPGATQSNFAIAADIVDGATATNEKPSNLPTSKEVAQYGYLIMMKGKSYGIHGFINKVMAFTIRLVPRNLATQATRKILEKIF